MTSLAWRLIRFGGRSALLSTGLTALAVMVATLLLQFAVAGNFAFGERADRTEWRIPAEAEGGSAVVASAVDYFGPDAITRVDLAKLDASAPAPPGLDAFPEPGQVWLSPALAELLQDVPEEDFLARYGGEVAGELGEDALIHPNDLVAVVGRDADDPVMTAERFHSDAVSPRVVDGFGDGRPSAIYGSYRLLMVLATVLMVVPVGIFGAAAARLTVARRDERLASLRLIGATPAQVVRLALIETSFAALAGAVAGTAVWMALTPLVARIPIDGGPWFVSDLWAGAPWMAAVALAVPALVAVSAVIGLRGVVISPLGVARRVRPKGLKAIRLVVFAVLAIAFLFVSQMLGGGGMLVVAILLGLLAGVLAAVNLVGPWLVQKLGRILARTAKTPARMLAARRLADDPKAAWRTVSGVALAGFVAGAVALIPMTVIDTDPRPVETLTATVEAEQADAWAASATKAVGGLAEIETFEPASEFGPEDTAIITATTSGADLEEVRTMLTVALDGVSFEREEVDSGIIANDLVGSVRVGVTVVLSVVFLTAAMSAAVNGLGSVLDRRKTYQLLHLSGMPRNVLDRARRQETVLPLALVGGGSVVTGMMLTAPMIGALGLDATGLIILAATLGIGTAAVIGAGALSRPLLRATMENVNPRPD